MHIAINLFCSVAQSLSRQVEQDEYPRRSPHAPALSLGRLHGHRAAAGSTFTISHLALVSFRRNDGDRVFRCHRDVLSPHCLGRNSTMGSRSGFRLRRFLPGQAPFPYPLPSARTVDDKVGIGYVGDFDDLINDLEAAWIAFPRERPLLIWQR